MLYRGSATVRESPSGGPIESGAQRLEHSFLGGPVTQEHLLLLREWYLQQSKTLGGREGEVQELGTEVVECADRLDIYADRRACAEGEHQQVAAVGHREPNGFSSRSGLPPQTWPPVRALALGATPVDVDLRGRTVEVVG